MPLHLNRTSQHEKKSNHYLLRIPDLQPPAAPTSSAPFHRRPCARLRIDLGFRRRRSPVALAPTPPPLPLPPPTLRPPPLLNRCRPPSTLRPPPLSTVPGITSAPAPTPPSQRLPPPTLRSPPLLNCCRPHPRRSGRRRYSARASPSHLTSKLRPPPP